MRTDSQIHYDDINMPGSNDREDEDADEIYAKGGRHLFDAQTLCQPPKIDVCMNKFFSNP